MRTWRILPILAMMVMAVAEPVFGQDSRDDDARVFVPASEYPWRAVGRVNNGQGGHCTGALIGPQSVLTAAHCLWNPRTRRLMPASALHFVAGWNQGHYNGASEVKAWRISPKWRNESSHDPKTAALDWAVLTLTEPLGRQTGWLALADERYPQASLTAVGYGQDHKQVPVAHTNCHEIGTVPGGLLAIDCRLAPGDSGGPVLVWRKRRPQIVAISVARMHGDDPRIHSGAVDIAVIRETISRLGSREPE